MKNVLRATIAATALLASLAVPARGEVVANGRILVSDVGRATGAGVGSMRGDGGGYRRLALIDDVSDAKWSPDKTRFAYYGGHEDSWELWVANRDGSEPHRVGQPYYSDYSWSPDSRYIAYVGITRNDPVQGTCFGVFIVDARTSATRELTDGPDCRAGDPDWSPSGDHLLITDGYDTGNRQLDLNIYKVDIVTGELSQLTHHPGIDRAPRWSPDGRAILFESSRDAVTTRGSGGCSRQVELFRMNAGGSEERRLTGRLRSADCAASWSDDGRRIVWTTYVKKEGDELSRPGVISVMKADGSEVLRLSNPRRGTAHSPDFSPDGRWVVFLRSHTDGETGWFDLHKVQTDGSRRARLTFRGRHAGVPDW